MTHKIRDLGPDALGDVSKIYPRAFPDEDLLPLVTGLLRGTDTILSLGAFRGNMLIGHVIFTMFDDREQNFAGAGALLGPLCVHPEYQCQGVGSVLVRTGFDRLSASGTRQVFVLGDPSYYKRFGFRAEHAVLPPYPLPEDWAGAWQSRCLGASAPLTPGRCKLPELWMQKSLWTS